MYDLDHLIELCAEKDTKSQRVLYDLLKEKLMGICFRYSQSEEDARDVFQEAMIRVFKNIDKAKEVDNFVGWVNRIARHVAIDLYRKSRSEMIVNIDESEAINFSGDDLNAVERLEGEEVVGLIKMLPYNQMLVFNLYILDGYSHKEIAEQLEIAESTSRVLLTRGKRRMIELLKKTEIDEQVYG